MKSLKRIYVVIPAVVEVTDKQMVTQPVGRQIAQACHVVTKLRHKTLRSEKDFIPVTTIILHARDQNEMFHVSQLLQKRKMSPIFFSDENAAVYGAVRPITAMAVYASKKQVEDILGYLPLWEA
ncbi:Uncharacterised protein [uncultured archaeon]|nr:Uncharacterised protein [uncultured archaeon]